MTEAAPRYRYEAEPGYEKRKNWKGKGTGSGRPAWEVIERSEAMRTARTYHDYRGAEVALDRNLDELTCGAVLIRRKRKRVRVKAGEAGGTVEDAPEKSPGDEDA